MCLCDEAIWGGAVLEFKLRENFIASLSPKRVDSGAKNVYSFDSKES